MKVVIWIISLVAIGLALTIILAGPGSRFGWWEYSDGLGFIRKFGLPVMIAAGVSTLAFIASMFVARGAAPIALIAALMAGGAAITPVMMKKNFESNPFIHDVTTDFVNPPPILAGADEPRVNPPAYLGNELMPRSEITITQAQREAFPDIKPIKTSLSVDDASAVALGALQSMNLKLLADTKNDEGRLIEAAYTSMWFGFVDDFIVRIEADGEGSVVNIRSKSRVGGSDLGANAKRIRAFSAKFKEQAPSG